MTFQLVYSSQGTVGKTQWRVADTSYLNSLLNLYLSKGFEESVFTDREGKGLWVLTHPNDGIRVVTLRK